eukprot:1921018-Amphidinium_carterae.1
MTLQRETRGGTPQSCQACRNLIRLPAGPAIPWTVPVDSTGEARESTCRATGNGLANCSKLAPSPRTETAAADTDNPYEHSLSQHLVEQ